MPWKNASPDRKSVLRVAREATMRGFRMRVAGEVRFIKDRGGDHNEWGWNPPGASERQIDPDYEFNPKNLEPLARVLRSALMALGHLQTARTVFTKIKSQRVSPDGNLGGKGYVMPIKDIRKQFANCDEALSAITDSIYDEINAIHWHPQVDDSGGNPRERQEVQEIMDDVEEIRDNPEEWAEGEEAEMDTEGPNEADGVHKLASSRVTLGILPSGQFWVVPFRQGRQDAPAIAPNTAKAMSVAKDVSRMPGIDHVQVHDSLGGLVVTVERGSIKHSASVQRVAAMYLARRDAR